MASSRVDPDMSREAKRHQPARVALRNSAKRATECCVSTVPLTSALLLAIFLSLGCGASTPGLHTPASSRGIAPAETRALLSRYSPPAHALVSAVEALPDRFELANGGYTVSRSRTFDDYVRDATTATFITTATSGVHETTHAYAGSMALQLQAERGLARRGRALAIVADAAPILVLPTETYPAYEMSETFPFDARTSTYAVYVDPERRRGAHHGGVYRFLDEYAAYYQGARTTADLWAWVEEGAPVDRRLMVNYALAFDAARTRRHQIRLFILHYLLHARAHRPDVYAGVLGNDEFRRAFAEVDAAFDRLESRMAEIEAPVVALSRARGADIRWVEGDLRVGGAVAFPGDSRARREGMQLQRSAAYRELAERLLRGGS